MDEYFKNEVEKIKVTRDMTKAAIEDLTNMANAMDEYINYIEDPYRLIFSNTVSEDLTALANKMRIYSMMASNKILALDNYIDGQKGEE